MLVSKLAEFHRCALRSSLEQTLTVTTLTLLANSKGVLCLTYEYAIVTLCFGILIHPCCILRYALEYVYIFVIKGAAERTTRFGRGIASGGERVQWWGARRRTAVYVPFSMYTMAWLGEHRAFIVDEFIKIGGFPGHVISLRGDIGWPPLSLDLTSCDFFL